jgi:hypothetical protein
MLSWGTTYTVGFGIIGTSHGVNSTVPVQRFIHQLKHADIAVFFLGMDNVCHPLEPLNCATVVVVIVEPDCRCILTCEGLVGFLSTRGAMETGVLSVESILNLVKHLLENDVEASITCPATELS